MFKKKTISEKNTLTYWLRHEAEDCGLMQPPLNAQKALDLLKNYLLGEDWYVVNPVNKRLSPKRQCAFQPPQPAIFHFR